MSGGPVSNKGEGRGQLGSSHYIKKLQVMVVLINKSHRHGARPVHLVPCDHRRGRCSSGIWKEGASKRKAWHPCPQRWVWVQGKASSQLEICSRAKDGMIKESLDMKTLRMSHGHPRYWVASSMTAAIHSWWIKAVLWVKSNFRRI